MVLYETGRPPSGGHSDEHQNGKMTIDDEFLATEFLAKIAEADQGIGKTGLFRHQDKTLLSMMPHTICTHCNARPEATIRPGGRNRGGPKPVLRWPSR